MKVAAERLDNSQAVLTIEVEQAVVDRGLDRAYQRVASKIMIPGFRRGKAPRSVVERHVGRPALLQEALDLIVPELYQQAVAESGIKPVSQPNFDVVQAEPLTLKATVDVEPEVDLGDYQSVQVPREPVTVSDEQVDSALDHLRRHHAEQVPVERPAQLGDAVTIDFTGKVGDEVVYSREDFDYELKAENTLPAPGFSQELTGLSVGDEKQFTLTLAEDFPDSNLAGQPLVCEVRVKVIKEVRLPEADDEFAKTTGEAETIAELRTKLRDRIRERLEAEAKETYETEVVDAVVERASVAVPASMIDAEINAFVNRTANRFSGSPLARRQFIESLRGQSGQLRENLEPIARNTVKRLLVLEAIAKAEGIDATDAEIDVDVEQVARLSDESEATQIRAAAQRADVRENLAREIRRRKAVERLVERAGGGVAPASDEQASAPASLAAGADDLPPSAVEAVPAGAGAPERAAGAQPATAARAAEPSEPGES